MRTAVMGILLAGIGLCAGCATDNASHQARIYEPAFLTKNLKSHNLLGSPSFEETNSLAWVPSSWRSDTEAASFSRIAGPNGKETTCALINTSTNDDVSFTQTVQVKPKTKYLLSGWVKYEKVTVEEKGPYGKIGVNLCIAGTWDHSSPLLEGSSDWKYLTLVFDSGDRSVLGVSARLGYYSNTTTGTAWFTDMCLVELPDKSQ